MQKRYLALGLVLICLNAARASEVPASGKMREGFLIDTKLKLVDETGREVANETKVILSQPSSDWTLMASTDSGVRLFGRLSIVTAEGVKLSYKELDKTGTLISSQELVIAVGEAGAITSKADQGPKETTIEARASKIRYQLN